jgi:hypothetical protein
MNLEIEYFVKDVWCSGVTRMAGNLMGIKVVCSNHGHGDDSLFTFDL